MYNIKSQAYVQFELNEKFVKFRVIFMESGIWHAIYTPSQVLKRESVGTHFHKESL